MPRHEFTLAYFYSRGIIRAMEATIEQLPALLKPKEVAKKLQVSLPTLARWRRNNSGPQFLKIGGSIRYTPAALEQWISTKAA